MSCRCLTFLVGTSCSVCRTRSRYQAISIFIFKKERDVTYTASETGLLACAEVGFPGKLTHAFDQHKEKPHIPHE